MIRSTKNETISAQAKQRSFSGGLLAGVYPRGESYELVWDSVVGENKELRDAFNVRSLGYSDFPSNNFNGSFE